jgi:uncharacterized protein YjiS (DUF1127 family)
MAYEHQQAPIDHPMHARAGAFGELISSVGTAITDSLLELLGAWRAGQARRELSALSDHMLKDIGLTRSEIDSMFR